MEWKGPRFSSQKIKRVEPLSWWVGMKAPLQLMVYGADLKGSLVTVDGEGVSVKEVHTADSPNYLFIDIDIASSAPAGEYTFRLQRDGIEEYFTYTLQERRRGSAARRSFSAADLVYLIVADRFANGDPAINSTPETHEKHRRKEHSGRHGGNIEGIRKNLTYLADLGVTTLWITPLLLDDEPQMSYHGYAAADYYKVDPRFGTNDLYRRMVEDAHNKGLKVIIDAVPNHCGTAHWWMKDLPFRDWVHGLEDKATSNFRFISISDPNGSDKDRKGCTEGWFDKSMPDLGNENPFLNRYLIQVYVWWIEWADLDGVRVDTFPYNNKEAAASWAKGILTEYPNLNITAECWLGNAPVVAYWQAKARNRDGYNSNLPSVMDFALQTALDGAFSEEEAGVGKGVDKIYEAIALDFLYPDPKNLLIFLDNHDTQRFADIVKGNPDKIKMALTLLATMRGIPQLTYGTELIFRSVDLKHGDGAARMDFPGGWDGDSINLFSQEHRKGQRADVFEHARKLFNWRKGCKALHKGRTMHFIPHENTYSFFRYTDDMAVLVLVNASRGSKKVEWSRYTEITDGYTEGVSVLDGRKITVGQKLLVKARSSLIVQWQRRVG